MTTYEASMEHFERIGRKRAVLEAAQVETEQQLCAALGRDYKAGTVNGVRLFEAYQRLRVHGLPGFAKRFKQGTGVDPAQLQWLARAESESVGGTWSGIYPFERLLGTPVAGTSVVYVLFDAQNVPCYVGSSQQFRHRLRAHAKDGKLFTSWQAHECDDRASAYKLEGDWLRQYKPYLNKKAWA